jgi:hypothetical protein
MAYRKEGQKISCFNLGVLSEELDDSPEVWKFFKKFLPWKVIRIRIKLRAGFGSGFS